SGRRAGAAALSDPPPRHRAGAASPRSRAVTEAPVAESPGQEAAAASSPAPLPTALRTPEDLVTAPRVSGLALAPDGRRLIASVATLDPEGKRHVTSLWELDPEGVGQPRRLTRSRPGEANPTFLPDGSILFTSTRDDPESKPPEGQQDHPAALWLLPAAAGEAAVVAAPPGGIDAFAVARQAGTVVLAAEVFDGAATAEADAEREKARREAGVAALLLEGYPFRFWDRFLAPRMRHLQVLGPLSPA